MVPWFFFSRHLRRMNLSGTAGLLADILWVHRPTPDPELLVLILRWLLLAAGQYLLGQRALELERNRWPGPLKLQCHRLPLC